MDRKSAWGVGFVGTAIVFLICACMCLWDLGHFLFSKRAQGTVTDVKHVEYFEMPSRRVVGHGTRISYRFAEADGTRREGADELSGPAGQMFGQQRGQVVWIEYTTGDFGSSRIAGNYDAKWILGLFISGGFLLVIGIVTWLQASSAVRALYPKKKKRKRVRDRDDSDDEDDDAELQERLRSPKHSRGSRL